MATHRSRTYIWTLISLALVLGLGISLPQQAYACSRVLWRTADGPDIPGQKPPKDLPVIVGRNMDWIESINDKFRVFPRGIHRDGLAQTDSLTWTSKYGSLVLTFLGVGTQEGMNEAGLSARTLFLGATDYGARDVNRPGLVVSLWVQYILDNFATVADAVQALTEKNVQIIPLETPPNSPQPYHLSIEDATGDSAIIEVINGQLQVYHDRSYTVMTNDPTYDQQLANLQTFIDIQFSTLPGTLSNPDRFVRAYHYVSKLYKPQDQNQAVSGMLGVLGNVTVPAASIPAEDLSPTWWRSVMDLTHRIYYFNRIPNSTLVWVDMSKLDFSPHALQREYDVEHGPLYVNGDITNLLRLGIAKPFVFKDYSDYKYQ